MTVTKLCRLPLSVQQSILEINSQSMSTTVLSMQSASYTTVRATRFTWGVATAMDTVMLTLHETWFRMR